MHLRIALNLGSLGLLLYTELLYTEYIDLDYMIIFIPIDFSRSRNRISTFVTWSLVSHQHIRGQFRRYEGRRNTISRSTARNNRDHE